MESTLARHLTGLATALLLAATGHAQQLNDLYTVDGTAAHDLLGISVDGVGDVDGDGKSDFAVGAFGTNNETGRVVVLSGATGAAIYTFDGDSAGDRMGICVAGAGDVNRDGVPDLVAGAYRDDNNGTDSGSVRVFSGKDGSTLFTFNGDSASDEFGTAVAGAGDVNNDGYADVIVGVPCDDPNGTDSGRARVYSGRNGAVLHTFDGDSAHDWFGYAVAGAGDVDNDGYDDVIVGACYDDSGALFNNGSARVYSGRTGATLHTLRGVASSDWFGMSVDGVGDLDGDSRDDFVIGASSRDSNGANAGQAVVYSGRTGNVLFTFNGRAAGDEFGVSVRGCGDVNGDRTPDIVVGAFRSSTAHATAGSAYVFSGKDGSLLNTSHGSAPDNRFGIAVGGAGDTNGDGAPDIVVGSVYADRTASNSGSARLISGKPVAMVADPPTLSVTAGGTQSLTIDLGTAYAGEQYLILGSGSGTSPGFYWSRKHVKLNYDSYMQATIDYSNTATFENFNGRLDSQGRATANINLPANIDPSAIGLTLYHAVLVLRRGRCLHASEPTALTLTN